MDPEILKEIPPELENFADPEFLGGSRWLMLGV
jgi:hypothetical protein